MVVVNKRGLVVENEGQGTSFGSFCFHLARDYKRAFPDCCHKFEEREHNYRWQLPVPLFNIQSLIFKIKLLTRAQTKQDRYKRKENIATLSFQWTNAPVWWRNETIKQHESDASSRILHVIKSSAVSFEKVKYFSYSKSWILINAK